MFQINKLKYYSERFAMYAESVQSMGKIQLFFMYIYSFIRYRCTIKDFFNYKFYLLNHHGKNLFLTGGKMERLYRKINKPEYTKYLLSKEETFIKYSNYMDRLWCGLKYKNTLEEYQNFLAQNDKCIIKPLESCGGHGIRIINLKGYTAEQLKDICHREQAIIEELIPQHDKMKALHPQSINTIRIVTENKRLIGAVVRIGSGCSKVDNASSGGMFAEVDLKSGIVTSKAYDYAGKVFLRHLDTNIVIIGYQIPYWNDIITMANKMCDIIPEVPIIGWDIALTPDGSTLVEVNEAPDLVLFQQTKTVGLDERILH